MTIPEVHRQLVNWVSDGTGLPDTVLHIHTNLALFAAARIVSGRSLGTFVPFAIVCVEELANELMDVVAYGWRGADTFSDIIHTCSWPLVLSIAVSVRLMIAVRQAYAEGR